MSTWSRSGSLQGPQSHWSMSFSHYAFLLASLLVLVLNLAAAALFPLTPFEALNWGAAHGLGSHPHPFLPLAEVWIRSLTSLGNSPFFLRLPGVLVCFAFIHFVRFLSTENRTALLMLVCPAFLIGGILLGPHQPFLIVEIAYLAWAIRLNRSFQQWSMDPVSRVYRSQPIGLAEWAMGGLLLSLGLLSHPAMGVQLLALGGMLLTQFRLRAWVLGFAVHLAVGGALLALGVWFAHSSFEPYSTFYSGGLFSASRSFSEGIFFAILSVGAVPFLSFPWLLISVTDYARDYRLSACYPFFFLTLLAFLIWGRREMSDAWALAAVAPFVPLFERRMNVTSFRSELRWLVILGFAPAMTVSALLVAHLSATVRSHSMIRDFFREIETKEAVVQWAQGIWKSSPYPVGVDHPGIRARLALAGVSVLPQFSPRTPSSRGEYFCPSHPELILSEDATLLGTLRAAIGSQRCQVEEKTPSLMPAAKWHLILVQRG